MSSELKYENIAYACLINSVVDEYTDLPSSAIWDAYHYSQGRHYHNRFHITGMMQRGSVTEANPALVLAIAFHDLIMGDGGEKKSADFLLEHAIHKDSPVITEAVAAILDTKTHRPTSELGNKLCVLDLMGFENFFENETSMMREYSQVPLYSFLPARVKILSGLRKKAVNGELDFTVYGKDNQTIANYIQNNIDYIQNHTYRLAIYPGSFNPYHVGHHDIVEQASCIFDQVIVAQAEEGQLPLPKIDYPTCRFDGLLVDFISAINKKIFPGEIDIRLFIVRGLRNTSDLQREINLRDYLGNSIPMVDFLCKSSYSHVSSTLVRELQKYGGGGGYLVR
jgi:phosphopantetheine adenylyltransferase/predicted metal-dependent HD superfamily phosphohydrolase